MDDIVALVEAEVLSWPGVVKQRGRFLSSSFSVNGQELGHLHGKWLADLPLPEKEKEEFLKQGIVEPHHVRPSSGWVTYRIQGPESLPELVRFLRINYDYYTNPPAPEKEATDHD